ncbi:hypothetical protein K3495_g1418 [Podosphaera aphanis]|nr:hypothetical protein K3495_g1418 [Podosphaera aphanis]
MLKQSIRFELFGQLSSSQTLEARIGRISLLNHGKKPIETPNYFSLTSRGVLPHITPDLIASQTQIPGVHLALEDLITFPETLSLHQKSALPDTVFTLLAPRRIPAVSTPTGNSDSAISVFTSGGFKFISNKDYINHTRQLGPDVVIALADVSCDTKPGAKRLKKMARRTQNWVAELLDHKRVDQAVFAPILPISASEQADYLDYISDEAADQLSGLAFYDSKLLPEVPATTAITRLARLSLHEPANPHEILTQISLGMDLITIPFIGFATDAGIALTFRFPRPCQEESSSSDAHRTQILGADMWSPDHATSLTPLAKECECYTCKYHHRAYVQHLLSAKEMLGWVLLQIHNHHILSEFFRSVRKSIAGRSFDSDREEFARVYVRDLPANASQGPRARGYHFKKARINNTQNIPAVD